VNNGTITVIVSAPGYVSQTKNFKMTTTSGSCPQDTVASFLLTKISSGNTTVTPNSQNVSNDLKTVVLPARFQQPGNSTTDLTKISDPTKVPDFTVDVVGRNKITFKEVLDLSSSTATSIISKLDTYIKADKTGVVEVDSKSAPFLNKKATITMVNLTFPITPKILVNGKEDATVVSNIKYLNGTLTFDVAHFTKFEAVASVPTVVPTNNTNSTNLIVGLGLLGLAVVVFFGGYLVYQKKRNSHPTSVV
jgi:hypothetical protein